MSRAEDIRIVRQLIVDFVPQTAFGDRSTIVGDALERFDRLVSELDDAAELAADAIDEKLGTVRHG